MKTTLKFLGFGIFFLFASCEKDDKPKDVFTLNSEQHKGFFFDDLKIIDFPNAVNVQPDFLVTASTNESGELISPLLVHPDLVSRFVLINEFQDLDKAQLFFNSFLTPEDKPLQQFASDIKPFQIWQIKTNSGSFGKILITETRIEDIDNTPFAEIKFKAGKME